jgi:uncharacterized protein YebE (UPF0316 family)
MSELHVSAVDAWMPALIFFARVTDVSIGTVRSILVMKGRRRMAGILGFFEAAIWVLATSTVFANLDHWLNIVAFAAGFAAGCTLGMYIEEKLALGIQIVRIISRRDSSAVASALRDSGYLVTTVPGMGRDGPVEVCMIVVARKKTRVVLQLAREIDPSIFVTVEDVRHTMMPSRGVCPREGLSWWLDSRRRGSPSALNTASSIAANDANGTRAPIPIAA